jgi:tetraacyldisaccharide 4'-kinase
MRNENHAASRSALEGFHQLVRGDRRGLGAALARFGLRTLSIPYGLGVRLRNWCLERGWIKTIAAPVPVVSVGNLTVGGTGKTPCVEWIARFFRRRQRRVAILSRGYGAAEGRNDEALVLEENLPDVPHLQGPDRAVLARIAAQELESEVLVLDDGFQHRRLKRDLDLVLIDATCPWGHGYLLPRGLLREPASGLRRAHLAILTRCDLVSPEDVARVRDEIHRWAPQLDIVETTHEPAEWIAADRRTLPPAGLEGRVAAAFCGLGNPEGFRRTLSKLGLEPIAWRTFPDHHGYTREDIESLRAWARELPPDTVVLTTQKDLVKIRLDRLADKELWALRIALELRSGQGLLEARLSSLVAGGGPVELLGGAP